MQGNEDASDKTNKALRYNSSGSAQRHTMFAHLPVKALQAKSDKSSEVDLKHTASQADEVIVDWDKIAAEFRLMSESPALESSDNKAARPGK